MEITYDPNKRSSNLTKHGLDFEDVLYADWEVAMINIDDRHEYGETRFIAHLPFNGNICVVCFTIVEENCYRIISFRKANAREIKKYYAAH